MICEVCGATSKQGFRIKIEGTVVNACPSCARGKDVVDPVKPKPKKLKKAVKETKKVFDIKRKYDVADDYANLVRKAREKMALTQEDLGKLVNESHSLIHRIELGKIEPKDELAKRLERALDISLLQAHTEAEDGKYESVKRELTLGDMIVVRKKKK